LEVLVDTCRHYAAQARALGTSGDAPTAARMAAIAHDLDAIVERPPQTLREAIQLLWLYNLLTNAKHVEGPRLDVALGDFYARDLDDGVLTEAEAMEQLLALWRLYHENGEAAVCRIVVGGLGRRNAPNADRFAAAAIEASRRFRQVTPQLTLRFHRDQNPALLDQAFAAIGEGCIYPMLYNDDVIVPGVAEALGVTEEQAREYHPLGCGEYMLAHSSPSLLCSVWSIPKTVEAAMRDGLNDAGRRIGPATGSTASLDTFDKLYAAFLRQVVFAARLSARTYRHICDVHRPQTAFLFASLLTDDCLARNRAMFDGGVQYLGACEMGHGFTNAADALTALRKVVYEDRRLTLPQIVTALDANFDGYADVRSRLLAVPKFGNDHDDADTMLADMWREINKAARDAGREAGLDFLVVSSVNPGGYGMGKSCGATADGRLRGEPFAIGNAPTAGQDRQGLTALCNSVAKVDPASGGAVTNFKLSRELFVPSPRVVGALFGSYFRSGGQQASITVLHRGDLEAAICEPAKYTHVLVRLGGWSARFVDLEPDVQQEILRRTLY
jgi:pyruvate-formate lyase